MVFMEIFGIRLRERAALLRISNAEVARRCGLGDRQYAYYVAGRREPNLQSLVKIADVLGTSVDVLLGRQQLPEKDARQQLLDRIVTAAQSLTDEQLRTISIQVEALADYKPTGAKPGRPAKLLPSKTQG